MTEWLKAFAWGFGIGGLVVGGVVGYVYHRRGKLIEAALDEAGAAGAKVRDIIKGFAGKIGG